MKKKAQPKGSSLERALDFLALAQSTAIDQSAYCQIEMGCAQAFNLTVGLGTAIEEDIAATPDIRLLRAAINRCGESFVITQLSPEKLLVRSGDFHAYIPCVDASAFVWCLPDAAVGTFKDGFMDALNKVAPLATSKGDTVLETSIQLNSGSAIATDRRVIMEAWHRTEFPEGLLLPKTSYVILKKIKKPLKCFGVSATSLTIYFDDGSWFYTKLYQDRWPARIRETLTACNSMACRKVPTNFFEAAEKVAPFSVNNSVYVRDNSIASHAKMNVEEGSGLILQFGGEHASRQYDWPSLKFISKHALTWNEHARPDGTYFTGEAVRGLICHTDLTRNIAAEDDDIPF